MYRYPRSGGPRSCERTSSRTWERVARFANYKPTSAEQIMRLIIDTDGNVFFLREDFIKPKYAKMDAMAIGTKRELWDLFVAHLEFAR